VFPFFNRANPLSLFRWVQPFRSGEQIEKAAISGPAIAFG